MPAVDRQASFVYDDPLFVDTGFWRYSKPDILAKKYKVL